MRLAGWFLMGCAVGTAHAVVVHGTVTGPLGRPVPGARVQLIALQGAAHAIADTVSGVDGGYEIRSDQAGRFLLLTSSVYYAPQLSTEFYGGRADVLLRGITLDPRAIAPQDSDAGTGLRLPLAQLSDPPEQVSATGLLTRALLEGVVATETGNFVLERGQTGQGGTVFVRGGGPESVGVLLDGQEISPLGGSDGRAYPLAKVSTTGLAAPEPEPAVEVLAGPDPETALSAGAGSVRLYTAQATNSHAALDYAGDAGNLHTWRDEAVVSATRRRADVQTAGSRFDTSNALPNDRFHLGALAGNAGYQVSGNTSLRITARQTAAAGALPEPYDLGLTPVTRDARQETVGTATLRTSTAHDWQNEVGYGLLRSREQAFAYSNPPGRMVTVTGANGYTVSGQLAPFPLPARQDWATLRDDVHYSTTYPLRRQITGLFEVRYEDERALDAAPSERTSVERKNLGGNAALTAELRHRLFAQAAGELTHWSSFGLLGSPRLGVTWVPVMPSAAKRLHGTALHTTLVTGLTEPSLAAQAQAITAVGRSRTLEFAVDQNLYREKLLVRGSYFHSLFSHQLEPLTQKSVLPGEPTFGDGLAYRAQGVTLDLRYQPRTRVQVRGSYTYLATLVEQSAEPASENPALPGLRIGALSALAGSRPFYRPPQTGSVTAGYAGRLLSAGVEASFVSRSDGSTGTAQTPGLLLPNRNLNHAYTRLDSQTAFVLSRHTSVFVQGENLLNDQHLGSFGYPAVPLTIRAGLRFRLGGD